MTVSTLREVLDDAQHNKYAVAGLVVLGWEDARCYAEAAEELGLPVILQAGPGCRANTPVSILGKMFRHLAEQSRCPIVCHLDHGYTKEELNLLENMFLDGFTIYKIARDLRRSQKSVRNNLIRLRLTKPPTETYIGSKEITYKQTNHNLLYLLPTTFLLLSLIQLITNFLNFNN